MQQFMLLSCPGDLTQLLVPMFLHGTPVLLAIPFSANLFPGQPPGA